MLLARGGTVVSTLDLAGTGFVVLAGEEGGGWCRAAASAAERLGIELAAHRVGGDGDLADGEGRFAAVYGIGTDGVVLVRPDGFIAWRTSEPAGDAEAVLTDVLERVLCRAG